MASAQINRVSRSVGGPAGAAGRRRSLLGWLGAAFAIEQTLSDGRTVAIPIDCYGMLGVLAAVTDVPLDPTAFALAEHNRTDRR